MSTNASSSAADPGDVHVSDLVASDPRRAAVFERLGIDYCCGGKLPLAEAVADHGLDLTEVADMLQQATAGEADERDWTQASIMELVANIIERHHGYLRAELPRLTLLSHKVARAHGASHPELQEAEQVVTVLVDELRAHTQQEEDEVFPACLQVAAGNVEDAALLANQLGGLVEEHTSAAQHMDRLRALLNDFDPPADACTSWRAYLDLLVRFELDLHRHVHKENHVLFEKVMDRLYEGGGVPGSDA